MLIISGCGPTAAGTFFDYYVDPTGTDASGRGTSSRPWKTIQYALDHADYSDSSLHVRIHVAAGRYMENLNITHPVIIEGDGAGNPATDSGVTVIEPVERPTIAPPFHTIDVGSRVEIYNLVFDYGRVMATMESGSLYLENVWFWRVSGRYGLYLRDVGTFNLVNCEFHTGPRLYADLAVEINNSVGEIHGGYMGDYFDHPIDISRIEPGIIDSIIGDGHVFRTSVSHVTVDDVTIQGSDVYYADGIRVAYEATAAILNSRIIRDHPSNEEWIPGSSDGTAAGIDLLYEKEGETGATINIEGNVISGFDTGIALNLGGKRVVASGNDISAVTYPVKTHTGNHPEIDRADPRVDFGGGTSGSPGGNIFRNVGDFAVFHQRGYEFFACFNDWEVTGDAAIEARIHDSMDDPSVGPVYWGRVGDPCGSASEPIVIEASDTPQFVEIWTDTPTVEPNSEIILTKNSFCREGTSTVFRDVDDFVAGTHLVAEGRNDTKTWVLVRTPDDRTCWIAYSLMEPIDLAILPAVPTPIIPTETPQPDQGPKGCLYYDKQQNKACFPINQCPVPFDKSLGACNP